MTPNGFFRVCQNGEGPTFARLIREIKQLLCVQSLVLYYTKQIDSMLPCICPVIDHRGRQNVVRTSVTHSAIASCATFWFLPHFDVICDLLLDRCKATWNLFVKYSFYGVVCFLNVKYIAVPENSFVYYFGHLRSVQAILIWKETQFSVYSGL